MILSSINISKVPRVLTLAMYGSYILLNLYLLDSSKEYTKCGFRPR